MNKEYLKYLLLFLSLSATALTVSYYQVKNHEEEVLKQEKEMLTITYNTITKAYKTHSEIYFTTKINVPEVHALMKKANSTDIAEKNSARGELYSLLVESYNSMQLFKIKQLHFHLPNNESFLRFHRVDKFGDSLEGIRDTVAYVNKHREPIAGFEEGRIYNGYRFIYPIIHEGEHYGSVEVSVSMHEIVKQLREETLGDVKFIIKKSIVEQKVFASERANYAQSKISAHYLYEKSYLDNPKVIEEIASKHPNLDAMISSAEGFNFFTCLDNKFYITTFIPIFNKYSKQQAGYMVINRSNPSLEYMFKKDRIVNSVVIFLLALLAYFYYKSQKRQKKFEQSNKMLNEIQRIAKLGSWEFDAKTNKLTWSDEVYNIFSVAPQSFEPTYDIFLSYVHPDDKEEVDTKFKESINRGSLYEVQHKIIKPNNTIAYLNEYAHHTYDEKGRYVHTIGTVHDVTHIITYEQKILSMQNELQTIVANIPEIIFKSKVDQEMTMLFVNSAIHKITGYKAQAFLLNKIQNYRDLIHPDEKEIVASKIQKAIKNNEEYSIEYRIINSLHDTVWVRESAKISIDENGMQVIDGVITDITHQKNSIDKLRKFIDIQDSIVLLTDGVKVIFANQKFFDFFGYVDLEEFSKEHSYICELFVEDETFFHKGKVLPKEEHWIRSILNLPGRERIVSMLSKNKNPHAFSVSINNYDPQTYIVNFSDISDTMFEKLQLKQKAIRDQLTGAYNRTFFDASIQSIINNNEHQNGKTGIILFDIDHFKEVNDNYGHAVGDEVLKTLVALVERFTRKEDKLIRWGGEEFVIIMYAKTIEDILRQAEHLRFLIQNHTFNDLPTITCSFGVALHEENTTIEESIKRADDKLYEAKRGGRNQVKS